jgi:quercetin dioxygenase-like cupin family protein
MSVNWDGLAERTVFPGFHGRFVHSERMTFARWRIEAGATLPEHSHMHEQVVHTYSGELELVVDGVTHRLTAGTVLVIPPNAPHSGRALAECDVMDVFAPVREDYR